MSKDRKPITARMKVDALLHRIFLQFGAYLRDFKGNELRPGDPVVFDHTHALTFKGPHVYENLRPCLKHANDDKAKRETRDHHHVNRLKKPLKAKGPLLPSSQFEGSRSIAPNSFDNRNRT